MFPNPFNLILRRPPPDYERGFVQEVNIRHPSARNRRIERQLVWSWVIIAIKSAFVIAVRRYLPFSPLWVIVPTVLFAGLYTGIYYWRD